MKIMKKLGALAASAMITASLAAPAMAATTYTPVSGPAAAMTFTKYLIVDADAEVPNASFAFTASAGTAVPATAGNMEILEGPTPGNVSISSVTFSPADTAGAVKPASLSGLTGDIARGAGDRASGGTAETGVELGTEEKYVTKTATVDLSGVSFSEPGIFRYVINETANAAQDAQGILNDTDTDRIMDVYVTDDGSGSLVVSKALIYTTANAIAAGTDLGSVANETNKSDGFTNEYKGTMGLAVACEVTGNQASRDKYFKYTVTVPNLGASDKFNVSLSARSNGSTKLAGNADAASGTTSSTKAAYRSQTNPTSLTGAQLAAGVDFYLQHGQSIVIDGIPKTYYDTTSGQSVNTAYTVAVDNEDYKSTEAAVTDYQAPVSSTLAAATGAAQLDGSIVKTSFKLTRDGAIPTGLVATVWTGVLVIAFGAAGIVFMMKNRKKPA